MGNFFRLSDIIIFYWYLLWINKNKFLNINNNIIYLIRNVLKRYVFKVEVEIEDGEKINFFIVFVLWEWVKGFLNNFFCYK